METSNASKNLVRLLKEVPVSSWVYSFVESKWETFHCLKHKTVVCGSLGKASKTEALVRRTNQKGVTVTILDGALALEVFESLCEQKRNYEEGKKRLAEAGAREEVKELVATLTEELEKNK